MEAVSDHCIILFEIPIGKDPEDHHLRFVPEKKFDKLSRLTRCRWHELFALAFSFECGQGWVEACHSVENFADWDLASSAYRTFVLRGKRAGGTS